MKKIKKAFCGCPNMDPNDKSIYRTYKLRVFFGESLSNIAKEYGLGTARKALKSKKVDGHIKEYDFETSTDFELAQCILEDAGVYFQGSSEYVLNEEEDIN